MVKRSYRADYTQCSFSRSLAYNRARAMYHIRRGLVSVTVLVLTCFGQIAELDALRCRSGMQNSVGYIYSSKPCKAGETACFQSVKCTKIGDTDYTDYKWTCIDGNQCSNSTGKYIARYNGIKGRSLISPCLPVIAYHAIFLSRIVSVQ